MSHRGGAEESAEGALESLVASARAGFPVEFDLHPLKDGQWAVAHDAKVDRILKGKVGPISAMTAAEWRGSCIEGPNGKCGTPATWEDVVNSVPLGRSWFQRSRMGRFHHPIWQRQSNRLTG